jgi:hypothetical protein
MEQEKVSSFKSSYYYCEHIYVYAYAHVSFRFYIPTYIYEFREWVGVGSWNGRMEWALIRFHPFRGQPKTFLPFRPISAV